MRGASLKQKTLFALKQELNLEGQAFYNACYYFAKLNAGVRFYDFVFIEGEPFSFEAENDLKRLNPAQRYADDLDFFLQIELQKMRNEGFKAATFEGYPSIKEGFWGIGYEGLSLDGFLARLLNNGVKILVDVRGNAYSNKFGFSKHELSSASKKVGILYYHIPELGITAAKREGSPAAALFKEYEESLPSRAHATGKLLELYNTHKSVAITCFEAEHSHCHRSRLTDFLKLECTHL